MAVVLVAAITASCPPWLAAHADAAAPAPVVVTLEYEAQPNCPDRDAFVSQMEARSAILRVVAVAGDVHFRVSIAAAEGAYLGTVVVSGPDRGAAIRTLADTDCGSLTQAMSLMVALTIDPRAGLKPVPVEVPPLPAAAPAPRPAPPAAPATQVAVAVGPFVRHGLWGNPALGASLALSLRQTPGGAWRPSFWGTFSFAAGDAPRAPGQSGASFAWFAGTASACAQSWRRRFFAVELPCLAFTGGFLQGEGRYVPDARRAGRFSAWAELDARVQVKLAWRWFAYLHGGAGLALTRPKFVTRTPDVLIHQTPAWGGVVGIGLGRDF